MQPSKPALLFCSLLALNATAAADGNTLTVDLKGVTVTGKRAPTTPNEARPLSPERRPALPTDGGDFLTQLNGVSGSRFGGRGIEPIIRGQSQTQLNVLLDGAYLHGGCPNRMDPPASYAALGTYESVRVEKGVHTLQHGSGGSGGTVLFERDTRSIIDPEDGLSGKVALTGSDNGIQHDLSADVTKGGEKGYARIFAQHRNADSYKDGNGKTVRSAYKHQQAGVALGLTPTENRTLEYSYEHNDFDDALYPGANMDSPVEKAVIHRLKFKDKRDGKIQGVEAEAYLSQVEHVMDNYSLRPQPGTRMSVPTTSDTTGGKLALTSPVGENTQLTYGLNVQNRERHAAMKNITAGGAETMLLWPGAQTDQTGVFAEATTNLGESGKLKYGLRVDQVQAKATQANVPRAMNPTQPTQTRTANQNYTAIHGYGADDAKETNTGALLRYENALDGNTTVFAGLSRTVRTADETERYINRWGATPEARWVGNPRLKPEKHHQLDAGISQQRGKLTWTGVVFADQVDDYILRDRVRTGPQTGAQTYRNIEAELYGAELGAEAKLSDRLRLSGDLAHVRSTNTTDKRPIAQTSPLNGKVQLDYNADRWGTGTRVRFAAGQDRIDTAMLGATEVGKTAGYGVADIYAHYKLTKSAQLRFGVDNVFDKVYAHHASRRNLDFTGTVERVNEPGRSAWLQLATEF